MSAQKNPVWGRIPFNGQRGILWVEKILVGFKGHPLGGPLFFSAHGVAAEQVNLLETRLFHPQLQAVSGGNKIGSWDLGVGLVGKQGDGVITWNGLGFQDEKPSWAQGLKAVTENINGRGPVVDDPHEKDHIKAVGKEWQMFNPKQIDIEHLLSRHAV